jgi:addiction module HigA family antidote
VYGPAHRGEVLRELWLEPMRLTLTEASVRFGITRKTMSKIVNGHGAITPEMALKLETVFGTSAQEWRRTVYAIVKRCLYNICQRRSLLLPICPLFFTFWLLQ